MLMYGIGQSLLTFVLQICGSGIGTLVGWAILQMFKGVGGYKYNPFVKQYEPQG